MIIGIDASNIKEGGGVTHLVNLLKASNPKKHNFIKIVIWCNKQIYPLIPNKKWISKKIIFDGNINFIKIPSYSSLPGPVFSQPQRQLYPSHPEYQHHW